MKNTYMKSYWEGYRAAKSIEYYCGIDAVQWEYDYGLNGQSRAYCAGYLRYLTDRRRRANE